MIRASRRKRAGRADRYRGFYHKKIVITGKRKRLRECVVYTLAHPATSIVNRRRNRQHENASAWIVTEGSLKSNFSCRQTRFHCFLKAVIEQRRVGRSEPRDEPRIVVDTQHLGAAACKSNGDGQSDRAAPDHGDLHGFSHDNFLTVLRNQVVRPVGLSGLAIPTPPYSKKRPHGHARAWPGPRESGFVKNPRSEEERSSPTVGKQQLDQALVRRLNLWTRKFIMYEAGAEAIGMVKTTV